VFLRAFLPLIFWLLVAVVEPDQVAEALVDFCPNPEPA
jgi:hypothetical protein